MIQPINVTVYVIFKCFANRLRDTFAYHFDSKMKDVSRIGF